jgi:broad specificity phosphatase PhoE
VIRRIIFIRPGETDWNRGGRWQGWVASPLNEHGKAQAASLARFVRHIGLSALYTSDLKRAMQTAEALAETLTFRPLPDERLRERSVGMWQGLTVAQMQEWYPEEFAKLLADRENFRIPGGESRADVRKRMRAAFDDILKQDRGETVAILSHTSAIKLLLEDVLPGYDADDLNIGNTSVTTIRRLDGAWEMLAADDQSHLEGLESQAVNEPEERR